jgi:hypothetical protein
MKIESIEDLNFIRLSFGYKSITTKDTTVEDVWELVDKVFSEHTVDVEIILKNHNVFKKPHSGMGLLMMIREEGAGFRHSGGKGKSKSKTMKYF